MKFWCLLAGLILMVIEWHQREHEGENNQALNHLNIVDALRQSGLLKYFHIFSMRLETSLLLDDNTIHRLYQGGSVPHYPHPRALVHATQSPSGSGLQVNTKISSLAPFSLKNACKKLIFSYTRGPIDLCLHAHAVELEIPHVQGLLHTQDPCKARVCAGPVKIAPILMVKSEKIQKTSINK